MSGGSHNYLYSHLAMSLDNIPSGSYNIGDGKYHSYNNDIRTARAINPMKDKELSELMYDVSCLLHSLEWWQSGDTDEGTYFDDVKKFKKKWFCRKSKQSIDEYKKDILNYLDDIRKTVDEI